MVVTQKERKKNREKQRVKLAKVYRKISNVREDYLHKISRRIVNENQVIACENLVIQDILKENHFARDILDASWSKLVGFIEYKSEWYGRQFVKVNKYYPSSQLCSSCGFKNEAIKNVNVKTWACPSCGTIHQRDINAGKNILLEGERLLGLEHDSEDDLSSRKDEVVTKGKLLIDVII